jgi:ADP-ribose pyrophosphatase
MRYPKIITRREARLSPWVTLLTKGVEFCAEGRREVYHCLGQADYIGILARTKSGLIPLVRQFRPAVERHTWELPAGLVESGEEPIEACRRELEEETGLRANSIEPLGSCWADTGRLQNRMHSFFVLAEDPDPGFRPESGLEVQFVSPEILHQHILTGEFNHQLHLGVLALASATGIVWDAQTR